MSPSRHVSLSSRTSDGDAVAHRITRESFLLPLKTLRLQSHPPPSSEQLPRAASPFLLGAHLISLSLAIALTQVLLVGMLLFPNIQIPHALPFRCILLAPSPGIITCELHLALSRRISSFSNSLITHSQYHIQAGNHTIMSWIVSATGWTPFKRAVCWVR